MPWPGPSILHQVLLQPGEAGPIRSRLQHRQFLQARRPSREVSHWSLSGVQLKLSKIGAKVISYARSTVFQMAEVAVPGAPFTKILARIRSLAIAPT